MFNFDEGFVSVIIMLFEGIIDTVRNVFKKKKKSPYHSEETDTDKDK